MALTAHRGAATYVAELRTGAAHTKGNYTEIITATPDNSSRCQVGIAGSVLGGRFYLADLATGAAASEVVRVANIRTHVANESQKGFLVELDVNIPSGTRVAMRAQSPAANNDLEVWMMLEGRGLTSASDPVTYGADTANSRGTLVDPGGTANTKGAYAQLTASATAEATSVPLFVTSSDQSEAIAAVQTWKLDIATGAAAAEVVQLPDLPYAVFGPTYDHVSPQRMAFQLSIPSGTRIAARCECSVNTATDRLLSVSLVASQSVVQAQKVTQMFLEVAIDEDANADPPPTVTGCSGSGTIASGTNPAAGTALSTMTKPLVWVEVVIGGTTYRWSKVAINDSSRKDPRVLSFGSLSRSLSDGRGTFELPVLDLELVDVDRVLRGLMNSATIIGAQVSAYVADLATVQAAGTARRVFYGIVRSFKPLPGLRFTLSAESHLAFASSAGGSGETMVPARLITSEISDQNPTDKMIGKPVPLIYGNCSDEDDENPVGVVPAPYIASAAAGPEDDNLHRFLLCGHALKNVQAVYLADYIGGGVEPITRIKAPASAYGSGAPLVSVPFQSGAFANYEDVASKRYSFVYGEDGHLAITLALTGRIPLAVNVCGAESTGDGTGTMISNPARACLHALNNRLAQEATGNWLSILSLGSYTLFDTTAWEAVATICAARTYLIAGIIGADFVQQSWRDMIADFCRNFDFDIGTNRHGQIIPAMLDRTSSYSSATIFTDQAHVLDNSLSIDPRLDDVENEIQYVYRRNYIEALHAINPAEGARPNRDPFDGKYFSGLLTDTDEAVITAMGGRPLGLRQSVVQAYNLIRDTDTAEDVAGQRLARLKSPRAEVTFTVTLRDGDGVELGDVIKLTHFEGATATGYTTRRLQVRRIQDDLDEFTRTLVCRDVENLLP